MPQAGLLGTIHFSEGNEEPRDFDGPQVLAPGLALQWLRDKLPNPIDRSGARRREAQESLFGLAREGIVNALVHRDYEIEGAKCQLIVTPDTIVVKSPGAPVPPVGRGAGLGLKSMRNDAQRAHLPLPKYAWEDPLVRWKLGYSPP